MLAPVATLVFLAAIWLIIGLILELAESDGAKVFAALRGDSTIASPQTVHTLTVRFQLRAVLVRQPMHVQPEWRVAA